MILKDDLESVLTEIPSSSRRDSSYYVVREYETYERSRYTARAVVDFHFLKGDVAKIVRKYRYHDRFGQWERYYNRYHFVDTTTGGGNDG